jgi:hypothetical protein
MLNSKRLKEADKARRGWWASVVFMMLIVALIVFLSYVEIQKDNRDILIGIVGMLTGSISSMLAIASGRDPSEVDDLKDKLSAANADRAALIGRLRDAQIQIQLKSSQLTDIQTAIIEKAPIWGGETVVKHRTPEDITLNPTVEEWLPDGIHFESEDCLEEVDKT